MDYIKIIIAEILALVSFIVGFLVGSRNKKGSKGYKKVVPEKLDKIINKKPETKIFRTRELEIDIKKRAEEENKKNKIIQK